MEMLYAVFNAIQLSTVVTDILASCGEFPFHEAIWIDRFHQRLLASLEADTDNSAVQDLATQVSRDVGMWILLQELADLNLGKDIVRDVVLQKAVMNAIVRKEAWLLDICVRWQRVGRSCEVWYEERTVSGGGYQNLGGELVYAEIRHFGATSLADCMVDIFAVPVDNEGLGELELAVNVFKCLTLVQDFEACSEQIWSYWRACIGGRRDCAALISLKPSQGLVHLRSCRPPHSISTFMAPCNSLLQDEKLNGRCDLRSILSGG